jgi:hypothetical protein
MSNAFAKYCGKHLDFRVCQYSDMTRNTRDIPANSNLSIRESGKRIPHESGYEPK